MPSRQVSSNQIVDNSDSKFVDIGGMRIQWGKYTTNVDTAQTVTFPAAFLDTTYSVITNPEAGFTGSASIGVPIKLTNLTTTTFDSDRDDDMNGSAVVHYLAIGRKP